MRGNLSNACRQTQGKLYRILDYTSTNAILLSCEKQGIYFGYPTGTYHQDIPNKGYNATGIPPDVPIPRDAMDPIGFILRHWR